MQWPFRFNLTWTERDERHSVIANQYMKLAESLESSMSPKDTANAYDEVRLKLLLRAYRSANSRGNPWKRRRETIQCSGE